MIDRRSPFTIDEAKFSTQKILTYVLVGIFAAVTTNVLYVNDQSERSMILQTVINLTLLAVGYWLGSSKGAADSNETISKITKPQITDPSFTTTTTSKAQEVQPAEGESK